MKNQKNIELQVQTVPAGIQAVDEFLAKLKEIQTSVFKTPCKISGVDIRELTDVQELVKAYSSVKARIEQQEDAYVDLGISSHKVVKVEGGTLDEWREDIKLRIDIINTKEEFDELNKIKQEYTELMDKEERMMILGKKLDKFKRK